MLRLPCDIPNDNLRSHGDCWSTMQRLIIYNFGPFFSFHSLFFVAFWFSWDVTNRSWLLWAAGAASHVTIDGWDICILHSAGAVASWVCGVCGSAGGQPDAQAQLAQRVRWELWLRDNHEALPRVHLCVLSELFVGNVSKMCFLSKPFLDSFKIASLPLPTEWTPRMHKPHPKSSLKRAQFLTRKIWDLDVARQVGTSVFFLLFNTSESRGPGLHRNGPQWARALRASQITKLIVYHWIIH